VLLVGADSVVGSNIAAEFAQTHQVVALTDNARVSIDGCEMSATRTCSDPHEWLADVQPDAVVHCGPAARSTWDTTGDHPLNEDVITDASRWAEASSSADCHLTFLSSDAVYTGPWMFHDEESECYCPSPEAKLIRQTEVQVLSGCPNALIIRTNAYGWAPAGAANGWIEQILIDLDRRSLQDYDYIRHATPILATDLADILLRAIDENLTGLHHVAGAERVNPLQFAQRLADQFDLPWLSVRRAEEPLDEPATGFGAGETSLQTKKIRKALCVAMPMLSEGLRRLRDQQAAGFHDQLGPDAPLAERQIA
jgi:dTDP-4-dehydrorhamnose reductase